MRRRKPAESEAGYADRENRMKVRPFFFPWRRLLIGLVVTVFVGIIAATQGAVVIPPMTVFGIVVSKIPILGMVDSWPESWETILWQIRLPRITLVAIVGATLAISGATYQGVFRNPLADPYLIGVASGAGLGATIVLVTGVPHHLFGFNLLPVAAFFGAILAVISTYIVARRDEAIPIMSLILAGVAISSLAGSITAFLMMRGDPDLRPVLNWLLGGVMLPQWNHSLVVIAYLVPSSGVVFLYARILNVLQLDEEHARQMGVNVERTKIILIASVSLATAAAVSFSGLIGFVGLVAPHTVRLIWGSDYRSLLPMAAIFGSGFLILADIVARVLVSPAEIPVGIVTAFCGAPFFLYLLRRSRYIYM